MWFLGLVTALSVNASVTGKAREAWAETSGVSGANLSRASIHHARVFGGAQGDAILRAAQARPNSLSVID